MAMLQLPVEDLMVTSASAVELPVLSVHLRLASTPAGSAAHPRPATAGAARPRGTPVPREAALPCISPLHAPQLHRHAAKRGGADVAATPAGQPSGTLSSDEDSDGLTGQRKLSGPNTLRVLRARKRAPKSQLAAAAAAAEAEAAAHPHYASLAGMPTPAAALLPRTAPARSRPTTAPVSAVAGGGSTAAALAGSGRSATRAGAAAAVAQYAPVRRRMAASRRGSAGTPSRATALRAPSPDAEEAARLTRSLSPRRSDTAQPGRRRHSPGPVPTPRQRQFPGTQRASVSTPEPAAVRGSVRSRRAARARAEVAARGAAMGRAMVGAQRTLSRALALPAVPSFAPLAVVQSVASGDAFAAVSRHGGVAEEEDGLAVPAGQVVGGVTPHQAIAQAVVAAEWTGVLLDMPQARVRAEGRRRVAAAEAAAADALAGARAALTVPRSPAPAAATSRPLSQSLTRSSTAAREGAAPAPASASLAQRLRRARVAQLALRPASAAGRLGPALAAARGRSASKGTPPPAGRRRWGLPPPADAEAAAAAASRPVRTPVQRSRPPPSAAPAAEPGVPVSLVEDGKAPDGVGSAANGALPSHHDVGDRQEAASSPTQAEAQGAPKLADDGGDEQLRPALTGAAADSSAFLGRLSLPALQAAAAHLPLRVLPGSALAQRTRGVAGQAQGTVAARLPGQSTVRFGSAQELLARPQSALAATGVQGDAAAAQVAVLSAPPEQLAATLAPALCAGVEGGALSSAHEAPGERGYREALLGHVLAHQVARRQGEHLGLVARRGDDHLVDSPFVHPAAAAALRAHEGHAVAAAAARGRWSALRRIVKGERPLVREGSHAVADGRRRLAQGVARAAGAAVALHCAGAAAVGDVATVSAALVRAGVNVRSGQGLALLQHPLLAERLQDAVEEAEGDMRPASPRAEPLAALRKSLGAPGAASAAAAAAAAAAAQLVLLQALLGATVERHLPPSATLLGVLASGAQAALRPTGAATAERAREATRSPTAGSGSPGGGGGTGVLSLSDSDSELEGVEEEVGEWDGFVGAHGATAFQGSRADKLAKPRHEDAIPTPRTLARSASAAAGGAPPHPALMAQAHRLARLGFAHSDEFDAAWAAAAYAAPHRGRGTAVTFHSRAGLPTAGVELTVGGEEEVEEEAEGGGGGAPLALSASLSSLPDTAPGRTASLAFLRRRAGLAAYARSTTGGAIAAAAGGGEAAPPPRTRAPVQHDKEALARNTLSLLLGKNTLQYEMRVGGRSLGTNTTVHRGVRAHPEAHSLPSASMPDLAAFRAPVRRSALAPRAAAPRGRTGPRAPPKAVRAEGVGMSAVRDVEAALWWARHRV